MNKWGRKINIKKNKEKYIKYGTIVLSVILLIVGVIYISYSKFDSKVEFTLINGKVVNSGDVNIVSYEYDGVKHDVPPTKDSGLVIGNVDCTNANGIWNEEEWGLDLRNITGKVKCNLTFNYSITYNLDGGTCDDCPTSYAIETDTFTLPTPTRVNATFLGWAGTNLDGNENTTVTINKGSTGNRSYIANWKIVSCTVVGNCGWYGVYEDGQLSECWYGNPSSGGTKCDGGYMNSSPLYACLDRSAGYNFVPDSDCKVGLGTSASCGGRMSSTYTCP